MCFLFQRVQLIEIDDELQRFESTTPPSEPISLTDLCLEPKQDGKTNRKRKCSDVNLEVSPNNKNVNKKIAHCEGEAGDSSPTEGADAFDLQTEKEAQPKRKHSKKKKKKVYEANVRPNTPTAKNIVQNTNTGSSKKQKSKQNNSSKKSSISKSPRTISDVVTKYKKTNKKAASTDNERSASKAVQPRNSPASASISSKTRKRSHLGSNIDGENQDNAYASSPTSTVTSNATMNSVLTVNSCTLGEDGNSPSRTGLLLTQEKNSARRKKTHSVPVHLSAGHIRFESSESESSSDDSGEENEKQASKQTDKQHPGNDETSKKSLDETLIRTDQQLPQNRTMDVLPISTPSKNSIPEVQSPFKRAFPSSGPFQNRGSPSLQRGSNTGGRESDNGYRGKWDKNSQLNTKQSNKSVIIQVSLCAVGIVSQPIFHPASVW